MTAGTNSPVFDFTSLDFQSVQDDLTRYAQATFPTDLWTDFNSSDFGAHMLELMAYATDLVAYNMNSQALETIAVTLVVEQNFRNVAKSLDYTLKSAVGSSGFVAFNLDPTPLFYPVTISHHLQVASTDNQVIFQPKADVLLSVPPPYGPPLGDGSTNVCYIAVQAGTESFEETLGTSNGLAGQQFTLANNFLIDGTLQVSVGAQGYTLSENAIQNGPTDRVYTLAVDQNGVATLTFGDGVNGTIPPKNQIVSATYYYGGGADTNLAPGTVTRINGTADGSNLPQALISCINVVPANVDENEGTMTGGANKESIAHGQANLPLQLKANERGVTTGDYAALAVAVPGVLKASATTGIYIGGSFPILLFVVPNGGGSVSPILANTIITSLKNKKLAGKRIRVFTAQYVQLVIAADAFVQANSPALTTANNLRTALDNLFALEVVDFGGSYGLQPLYESTDPNNVAGLSRVFYKVFSVLPYSAPHVTKPVSGTGVNDGTGAYALAVGIATQVNYPSNLIDPTVGITIPPSRVEWFIEIVPSDTGAGVFCSQFKVIRRRLGTVTTVLDNLITDESANYLPGELVLTPGVIFGLQPNPDSLVDGFPPDPIDADADGNNGMWIIQNNTQTTIQVAGGLLASVEPGDPYVVSSLEPTVGKIKRGRCAGGVVASTIVPLDPASPYNGSQSFQVGDRVRIWTDTPYREYVRTSIVGVPDASHIEVNVVLSSIPDGANVDYLWQSSDGSTQFSVIDGYATYSLPGTAFVPNGDSFYVDTYAAAEDIELRPENYPLIADANINITTVGGVK